MPRRRSRIREAILKAIYTGRRLYVAYRHREDDRELVALVPVDSIERVDRWAIHTAEGDTIPFHRVVEIRDGEGRAVWRRGEGWLERNQ